MGQGRVYLACSTIQSAATDWRVWHQLHWIVCDDIRRWKVTVVEPSRWIMKAIF